MQPKYIELKSRYNTLESDLQNPAVINDAQKLKTAAQEYNIDLTASLMFGDVERDLLAGIAAGCLSFNMTQLMTMPLDEVAKVVFSGTIVSMAQGEN